MALVARNGEASGATAPPTKSPCVGALDFVGWALPHPRCSGRPYGASRLVQYLFDDLSTFWKELGVLSGQLRQ